VKAAARAVIATAVLAAGCRTPAPAPRAVDPEVARLARSAMLTHRRVSAARALPLYRAALDRAEALGDPESAGALAHNLAVCQAETGDLAAALATARAARRDLERAGRSAADPLALEAALLRALDDGADAAAAADRALAAARAARRPELEAQMHALRAEMAIARADLASAEAGLTAARRVLGKGEGQPAARARIENVAGRLAESGGQFAVAAAAYAREAELWGLAGLPRRVPPAFARAAGAASRAGAPALAAERWLDAARSYAGQGDAASARSMLDRIAVLPSASVAPQIRAEAEALAGRLSPPADPDAGD